MLTIELISGNNLISVDKPFHRINGAHKLEGPTTHARDTNGMHEFVNLFRYAVTPLKSGMLQNTLYRIRRVLADANKTEFKIQSRADLVYRCAAN